MGREGSVHLGSVDDLGDCEHQMENSIQTLLHDPEPESRYQAIDSLQHGTDRADVVEALIIALGDEGYYEILEPGAPSFVYAVNERVLDVLKPIASGHFDRILDQMQSSVSAMLSGLSLMPSCGEPGSRVVLDALDHPDGRVPPRAATVLSSMLGSDADEPDPRLMQTLLRAMIHQDVFVRSTAIDSIASYFARHPDLDPVEALPPGFLEILAQAVLSGKTRPDAGWPFLSHHLMLEAAVHRAAGGDDQTAHILRKHLVRLDDALVALLTRGVMTPGLAQLLGDLGERARDAIPALLAARRLPGLEGWAAVALLRIPGGESGGLEGIEELFMSDETIREAVLRYHPDPEGLAEAVIPRFLEQWQRIDEACRQGGEQAYTSKLAPWRGMRALGPLMVVQLPWLLNYLEPYGVDKIPRRYAIEIISTFGEAAGEAFPKLARLLDQTDDRGTVLKALTRLGTVAAPDFQTLLEVLELESRSWTGWQWNWWRQDIVAALGAVREETHGAEA